MNDSDPKETVERDDTKVAEKDRRRPPSQSGQRQSDNADSGGVVDALSGSDLSIDQSPSQPGRSGAKRSGAERLTIHTLAELLAAMY